MLSRSPGQFRQADAIFDAALDLEPEERAAFVERACEGNGPLRSLVLRLLRSFERSGGFLAEPAVDMARPLLEHSAGPDGESSVATLPDRVGPYLVMRELGRGGMGVVYLAEREDDAGGRPVALKVVRGGALVAGAMLRRFLAERHILGTLEHPYVARLLETGITSDGTPYFAMEYCPGGSLADGLARRPLSVPETLRIARQLALALAAAHELGIVHRDVKPANVLFNDQGDVQLTDFGVAKLLDQDSTLSGALLGTPAYLAPEQLRGTGVDHRADLWALGVTLYQMLAGRRPFEGGSFAAILHAVVTVEPDPLDRVGHIPPALGALLRHLLRKDPEARPQSAGDVAAALAAIEADPAFVYVATAPELPEPTSTPSHRDRGASVVVVPFSNTSGNADDTPFTDGLTDELISALGKVRGLRVTARTTAFALRGKGLDARAVANMIGVAHLLEGSVRRDGERLKVTAQLVSATQGTVTWTETYDREVRDIFALQEELARAIVEALGPALGLGDAPVARRPLDVATYELFLKGRYFWEKRTAPDLGRAADYFEQAVLRDPTYAEAYAGIVDALTLLIVFCGRRPADELPRVRVALAEALRLGRDSAMVHAANGNVLSAFEWRWAEAESESRRAIELDPGLINARVYLSILLQHLGRCDEAIEVAQRALTLDPLSPPLNLTLGRALLHARRPAEALGPLRTAVEIAPGFAFAQAQLGHVLLQLGRVGDALEAFRRGAATGAPNEKGQLAYALASTGDAPAARELLGELLELESRAYLPPFGVACAYTGLGDRDAAFAWLEKGFSERAAQMNTIKVAPVFDALRGDRRWGDLLARMGLAPS